VSRIRKRSVSDLTTTVLTLTVNGLAADSSLVGGSNPRVARRLGSIVNGATKIKWLEEVNESHRLGDQLSTWCQTALHPNDFAIEALIEGLQSPEAELAWQNFLHCYAEVIYAVVKTFARDADGRGDCFIFVCEKLADKRYRRLRAFRADGKARFSTWLWAVTRNLCLDWHRARFGRKQAFRSVGALGAVGQRVFALLFQKRLTSEEVWREVAAALPGVSYQAFEEECDRVRRVLTSRQLWLLSAAQVTQESLDIAPLEAASNAPDPETLAVLEETHRAIERAVSRLDSGSQLLLRLRFTEDLGLQEVAKLVGLKDAQTADRRIRAVLEAIRQTLQIPSGAVGKTKTSSV